MAEQDYNGAFKRITADQIERKDGFYLDIVLFGASPATAANYGIFHTFYHPAELLWVSEVHQTAGSDGGAVTLQIERLSGTEASGAGDDILVAAFSLKGTADTVVQKSGTALNNYRQFTQGERIGLVLTGTPTSVANLTVTCYFKHLGMGDYR
jgi:hypothetical protein